MTSRPHASHLEPSQLFIREESGPDQNGAVLSSHLPEVDVLFHFDPHVGNFVRFQCVKGDVTDDSS